MEKVRPWCGQPSDRGRLRDRTEQRWQPYLRPRWCGWCRSRRRPCWVGRPIVRRSRTRSVEWLGCAGSSWCCSDLCCLRARRTTRALRSRLHTTRAEIPPLYLKATFHYAWNRALNSRLKSGQKSAWNEHGHFSVCCSAILDSVKYLGQW